MGNYVVLTILAVCAAATGVAQEDVNAYLRNADYEEGIKAYTAKTAQLPQHEDLFALAALHFLGGIENLVQGLYTYGLKSDELRALTFYLPLLVIPIPKNPAAQPVRPEDLAMLIQDWYDTLQKTEKILTGVGGEAFNLRLNLGEAAIDINNDGQVDQTENLMVLCSPWLGGRARTRGMDQFYVNCDQADALWLRGYCLLLMGFLDIMQAHDWREFYARTAHLLFEAPDNEALSLYRERDIGIWNFVVDIAFLLHEFHLEVVHPEKYEQARGRFLEVIQLSRAFWETVDKETDDDHEWIPNARQTAASGGRVTQDMIDSWKLFLDEMELILMGQKLIPHFRIEEGYGINLAKVVATPPPLDSVQWFSGHAALPYLEKGDLTNANTWRMITQAFSGNFLRAVIWFN